MELHPELAALLYPVMTADFRDELTAQLRRMVADNDLPERSVRGAARTLVDVFEAEADKPIDGNLFDSLLYFGLVEE